MQGYKTTVWPCPAGAGGRCSGGRNGSLQDSIKVEFMPTSRASQPLTRSVFSTNLFPGFAKPLFPGFACVLTYRSTMTIDKHNPNHQRQQLSQALWSFPTSGDLGLRARSMLPNSRRQDPKEQRAFLRSILEEAIELANDIDACFDTSSDNTDGEQDENSRSHDQNQ
jgi:hypothetical protein